MERLLRVALDDGLLRAGPVDGVAAVDEQEIGADGELLDGQAHGQQRGLANIDAVDGFGIDGGDGPGHGVAADFAVEPGALLRGEFL